MRSRLLEVTDTYKELYTPQRTMQLGSVIPHYLAFALNDSRLIMGLKSGEIAVFDSESLCTPGTNEIQPLHTFSSPTGGPARFIMPNPGDLPELVAVLREPDGRTDSQLLEVLDVAKFQTITGWRSGGSPKTYPTSCTHLRHTLLTRLADSFPQWPGHRRGNNWRLVSKVATSSPSVPRNLHTRSRSFLTQPRATAKVSCTPHGYQILCSTLCMPQLTLSTSMPNKRT